MKHKSEIQILAHLLAKPKNYIEFYELIHEDLFVSLDHKKIFSSIQRLIKSDKSVNIFNVSEEINGDTDKYYDLLINISEKIDHFGGFENHLHHITQLNIKEKLKITLKRAILSLDNDKTTQEVILKTESSLNELKTNERFSVKKIGECLGEVYENIDNKSKAQGGVTGVGTGFKEIDKLTGGWQKGDLVIIAGDTSQGKTSISLNFMLNASKIYNKKTVIFSYEMTTLQLASRFASLESGISSKDLINGTVTTEEINLLSSRITKLTDCEIYIDKCRSNKFSALCSSIKSLVISKGIELIVIDYLQLITTDERGQTTEQMFANISRDLKNLAKSLEVPIIVLSQLSRKQNARPGGEPKLGDLRGSGQIEEASDVVAFVYRPEYYGISNYEDGETTENVAEFRIEKGRNIGLSRTKLKFIKHLTKFQDFDFEEPSVLVPNNDFENDPF